MASTGPIFKRLKIVNFVTLMSGHDWRPHKSIIMHRNDTKSNLTHLINVSYNGVGLGGGFFPVARAHLVDLRHLPSDSLFLLGGHLHVHSSMHGAADLGPASALPMHDVG